jgi:hypothetical protein
MSLLTVIQLETLFILALFLPLVLQLVVLYLVSRGLWRFSGRYFGRGIWALLAFVGVPIHELSHAAAFLLTGAGVQRLVLFAPRGLSEYGGATGVTIPARQPTFISRLVASIAPFFGCSLAAWLVLRLLLPGFTAADVTTPVPIGSPETAGPGQVIGQILGAYPGILIGAFARLQWTRWQTYLALYLGASLGMGAAPSREDFRHFFPALLGLLVVLLPVFALIQLFSDPAAMLARFQTIAGIVTVPIGAALIYATVFSSIALLLLAILSLPRLLGIR